MSWVRIWAHLVFSTKNKEPFLQTKELRFKVYQHIKKNALSKGIYLNCIGGYTDHFHCLISLGREQTISKVAQLIKGESSYWINKSGILKSDFKWQDDYWAVGVSESHVNAVRDYIKNQEEHHRVISFTEEVDNFMKKYGWKYIK